MTKNESNLFFESSGIWEGMFTNFVNQKGGIEQEGKIRVRVEVDDEGIISLANAFLRPDGTQTNYEGSLKVKVEGNSLVNLMDIEEDPNTGNKIENHQFEGYITNNHIFIKECFEEVLPEGNKDYRENSVHYCFISEEELIMLADVYLNNDLLVFANTKLRKRK